MNVITDHLTPREVEVLTYLGKGMSNPEIAKLLDIEIWTVVSHIKHIFAKLNVDSRVEAAVWACKQGML